MPLTTAVVGRQPIVDRDRAVIGYELLFRAFESSDTAFDPAAIGDVTGDDMTTRTMIGAMGVGVERLIGSKIAFCNGDRGLLTGSVRVAFPPSRTVIEVLETVTLDDAVLGGCEALKAAGYRLAADDFRDMPESDRLLELVDIVKIDLRATPMRDVEALLARCRPYGVTLLAEKVETDAELATCMDLGFDLFQGYLLGRPNTISSPALGPSRHGVLRLAAAFLDPETDYQQLENILRMEPALAYRLLQLAAIGRLGETKRTIRSIREALVTVGLDRIRGWLPALLLRPTGPSMDTALPTVLGRARLAELLAGHLYPSQKGFAFTAGMLSAFDLLLGIPRTQLPSALEIPEDLRQAAFGGSSQIGQLVDVALAYQQEGAVPDGLPGIDAAMMDTAAAQAFGWAVQATELVDKPAA